FVLQAKEASNKILCASNLRQMGIAAHNYHNDFSFLPVGYYGPFRANGGTDVVLGESLDRGPWSGAIVKMRPYCFSDKTFKNLWRTEKTYPVPPDDQAQLGWQCGLIEERQAWWLAHENLQANTGQAKSNSFFCCPSDVADESTSKRVLYAVH